MARGYDVVMVGGGHNGLTCACYLAKAGKSVLVLETREVVGGGCATKEVAAPGFRHNFHSNFHGIIHMGPVYRDLELERYGARYVWPENQFAHVFPNGNALVWSRSLDRTIESVERFSKRDARTVRELALTYRAVLEDGMIPALFSQPGPPSSDLAGLESMPGGIELARHFLTTPNHLARSLFESEEVQTWIGFWVAQLAGTGDVFGLGANFPIMLAGSTEPYGWAICDGGSVKLAEAMAAFLRDHGGEIRTDATVRQIVARDGRASEVVLDDATRIPVPGLLVSNLDPRHTFLELVGEGDLPADFVPRVKRWRYDVMSMFCVYLALEEPVRWKAAELHPEVQQCFAVSMCESLDVLDDNASECRLGIPPRTARALLRPPLALRAESVPRRQGGVLRRADRSLRARRRRSRGLGGVEERIRGLRRRPLARVPRHRPRAGPDRRPLRLEPDRHRNRHAVHEARRLEPRRDDPGPARHLPALPRVPALPHGVRERLPLRRLHAPGRLDRRRVRLQRSGRDRRGSGHPSLVAGNGGRGRTVSAFVPQIVLDDAQEAERRRRFPLGEAIEFADLEEHARADALDRLRDAEPVSWVPVLGGWLVTSHALGRDVLGRRKDFTVWAEPNLVRASLGVMMLTSDGDEHDRQRLPFDEPFRMRAVRERFETPVSARVEVLLAGRAATRLDASSRRDFAAPFAIGVAGDILGLSLDDVPKISGIYDAFAGAMVYDGDPEPQRRADAARETFDEILLGELARDAHDAGRLDHVGARERLRRWS